MLSKFLVWDNISVLMDLFRTVLDFSDGGSASIGRIFICHSRCCLLFTIQGVTYKSIVFPDNLVPQLTFSWLWCSCKVMLVSCYFRYSTFRLWYRLHSLTTLLTCRGGYIVTIPASHVYWLKDSAFVSL